METIKPGDIDPTIGTFTYSQAERQDLMDKGFTKEEIDQKEREANARIAAETLRKEMEAQGMGEIDAPETL
jgi:hypothetical protein